MGESRRIFGIDFTSAPTRRKPITVAEASLNANRLSFTSISSICDWQEFENFLETPGPWRAGFDFPFGQPALLLDEWAMEGTWEQIVLEFNFRGRENFESQIRKYTCQKPTGQKRLFRLTDRKAVSCSPMQLDFVPVGKMFITGAPRLAATNISILPVRVTMDSRQAVETYPKLVAEKVIGKRSYKADARAKQTLARQQLRSDLLRDLGKVCAENYGLELALTNELKYRAIEDASGDSLDALLCAIQAAWSCLCENPIEGIPVNVELREGWIVDPSLV